MKKVLVLVLVLVMVEKSEKGFRFSHLKAINKKKGFCFVLGFMYYSFGRGFCYVV